MAVKTEFSKRALIEILSNYALGELQKVEPFSKGAVQTNLLLHTTKGKVVFRYYENRSKESVLFETNLLQFLKAKNYPCPAPFRNKHGKSVAIYDQKPYVMFEFMEGQHIENPNQSQKQQLIKKAAELQNLTKNYRPLYKKHRWNYNVQLCTALAREATAKLMTETAKEKLKWFETELLKLRLPNSLPKGICHCDFHFSNVLFKDDKFNALLDFDDANYTFLVFDLVKLMEAWAWQHAKDKVLNFNEAKKILEEYQRYRLLNDNEKNHLFDVYKLSIMFDGIWYFARGDANDFYEKRKITFLDSIGREEFYRRLLL